MNIETTPRESIRDLLATYCRGIDRRDRNLVTSCFHPAATDDHGNGPLGRDDFVDWCFEILAGYDSTFHFLGQSSFVFDSPAEARVETYGIASHRTASGPDHRNLVTGFRYLDIVTAVDKRWRIATRVAVTDWSRVDREDDWWPVPTSLLHGVAGSEDPGVRHLRD